MSACRCEQCSAEPAPTWTEGWRQRCEARYVAALGKEARKRYMERVEKERGRRAALRLWRAAKEEFMRRRDEGEAIEASSR